MGIEFVLFGYDFFHAYDLFHGRLPRDEFSTGLASVPTFVMSH